MGALLAPLWETATGFLFTIIKNPIGSAVVVFTAFALWNFTINNPRIRREATADLVSRVELAAEKAKREEAERQVQRGEEALLRLQKLMTDWETAQEAEDAQRDQEIADLTTSMAAAGKSRLLDADDCRWLQRHDQHPAGCSLPR